MEKPRTISVKVKIHASIEDVWNVYNNGRDVRVWKRPSDEWHVESAYNDLRVGGHFNYQIKENDQSEIINFMGSYVEIIPFEKISFVLDDSRNVCVVFVEHGQMTEVIETFEVDETVSYETQVSAWQSILNNLKTYIDSNSMDN